MGHPDGAHTHGRGHGHGSVGGGGDGAFVLLLILAGVLAVGPVVAAVLQALLIFAVSAAAAILVAAVVARVRRVRRGPGRVVRPVTPPPWQAVQAPPGPRPAIERPQEVHLHLHGLTPQDAAAILAARLPGGQPLPPPEMPRR
jgi:hypothetical protein